MWYHSLHSICLQEAWILGPRSKPINCRIHPVFLINQTVARDTKTPQPLECMCLYRREYFILCVLPKLACPPSNPDCLKKNAKEYPEN